MKEWACLRGRAVIAARSRCSPHRLRGRLLPVRAGHSWAYCSPRQNLGPWHEVEVGFPSAKPELIAHLAEDDNYTETVYPYVDIELVEKLIELHGGPDNATRAAIAKATGTTHD
jgi:hypothetical protein